MARGGKSDSSSESDNSDDDLASHIATMNLEPPKGAPAQSDATKHRSIDDCIEQLEMTFVNVLTNGPNDGDDTVIFVKAPPRTPDQSTKLYEAIVRRYQWPFFGRSEVFKKYAPEFYETYFSVTYQPRYRRRFASWFNLHSDLKIRYALDLTPAIEGDEAIQAVTQLQCPEGVLKWHMSTHRFGTREDLVDGPLDLENGQELQGYSQVRHNLAIERMLLALHGHNPQFNSAIKVYTTAMLAKQFGIVESPLQDWVISWFSAANNSVFIEVLPEATLAIADSLQLGSLAMEAFAVLVGESCLEIKENAEMTLHDRKRYEIDETWQSRLQYAKQPFERRVEEAFAALADDPLRWMHDMPEYRKLREATEAANACGCGKTMQSLSRYLANMLRYIIHYCLNAEHVVISSKGFDRHRSVAGNQLYKAVPYNTVWALLGPKKRIFTRVFWRLMASIRLDHFAGSGSGYHVSDVSFYDNFYLSTTAKGLDPDSDGLGPIYGDLRRLRASLQSAVEARTVRTVSTDTLLTDDFEVEKKRSTFAPLDSGAIRSALQNLQSFSVTSFFRQAQSRIASQAFVMLRNPVTGTPRPADLQLTNVLLCLTETELRYLPLWAGGNDDGSGGVFDNDVPQAYDGFSSHGPFIHLQNDTRSGDSEYSYVSQSTDVPSSCEVNDGFSDTLDRRRVYAASDVESDVSWTDVLEYRDKNPTRLAEEEVESLPETTIAYDEKQTESSTRSHSEVDVSENEFDVVSLSDVAEGAQTEHQS